MNIIKRVWRKIPQGFRYAGIILASLAVSVTGVYLAALFRRPADGGRGGAIAAIVALGALFLRRDYGRDSFEEREGIVDVAKPSIKRLTDAVSQASARLLSDAEFTIADRRVLVDLLEKLAKRGDALEGWLRINSTGQSTQNRILVSASIIGTLFWGFGDMLASLICKCPCLPCSP